MDHLSGSSATPPFRDRVRAAAADACVLPGDALGPLIENLADLPNEVEMRIAPALARVEAAASGALAARAAAALPAALDRLVWQRFGIAAVISGTVLFGLLYGVSRYEWNAGHADGLAKGEARAVHLEAAIGHELTRGDAEGWLALMQNNDRLTPASCVAAQDGRKVCHLDLWASPPVAPPPAGKAQTVEAAPPTKKGK